MKKIEELNPKRVFYHFQEISKIPRESHNEKEISNYLVEFGKKLGLETFQDEHLNVILRKRAKEGYEHLPKIILQGHMDMVCEKESDSNHDFTKDPIKLVVDGNILKADKTTLGADNGIAIAMAMAVLEDENIHNQIELLATTREEVDLGGAMALAPNLLEGKMLINIDSEDEGVVTVGSAGGEGIDIQIPIEKEKLENVNLYTIELSDLKGGHSGVEINQKRGNANKIMVELLSTLADKVKFSLVEISGGSKDNAIPRAAKAVIASSENIDETFDKIDELTLKLVDKYGDIEPDMSFVVSSEEDTEVEAITAEGFDKYVKLITEIPTGVNTWMKEYPTIVESSDNLAIIKTNPDEIYVIVSLRSAEPHVLAELKEKVAGVAKVVGAKYEFNGDYPEWRFKSESKLRDKALEVYKNMYGKEMKVEIIHAGLECGAISQNYSDVDFISVGPNLRDVHTPGEYLEIESTARVYEYLLELIKAL